MNKEIVTLVLLWGCVLLFGYIWIKLRKYSNKVNAFIDTSEKEGSPNMETYYFKQSLHHNLKNDNRLIHTHFGLIKFLFIISLYLSIFKTLNLLNDYHYIQINLNSEIVFYIHMAMFTFVGISLIVYGKNRYLRVKVKYMEDLKIECTVIGYGNCLKRLPGMKPLRLEYIDPKTKKVKNYTLNYEVSVKKHPVGSNFELYYTNDTGNVYDKKGSNTEKRMSFYYILCGILILVAVILNLMR